MEWIVIAIVAGAAIGLFKLIAGPGGEPEPTERQWEFIEDLPAEREYDEGCVFTPQIRAKASELIDYLLSCPRLGRD